MVSGILWEIKTDLNIIKLHIIYRFNGKRKTLSLGTYPDTKLKKSRELRNDARKLISKGIDPGLKRRLEKTLGVIFKRMIWIFVGYHN